MDAEATALPTRLVDYFGVVVTSPQGSRARTSTLQFRRPCRDHADLALPDNLDWFLFPDGIWPTRQQVRPDAVEFAFVLTDAVGLKLYVVCRTTYRCEGGPGEDDGDDIGAAVRPGAGDGGAATTLWWPGVSFLLTRFPFVPQLQLALARLCETFDSPDGVSTAARCACSLDDYLRMLIFEVPVPLRRLGLGVSIFFPAAMAAANPSEEPRELCSLRLPAPESLPLLQFPAARGIMRLLPPSALLRFLAAVALCKPIAVVAGTAQELTEVCEAALALVFPLQWEFGYVPLLPSSMGDLLQSPSPLLAGLLASYASRTFEGQGDTEISYLVVVDATKGIVDVGVAPFLERHQRRNGHDDASRGPESNKTVNDTDSGRSEESCASAAALERELYFPEPVQEACLVELRSLYCEAAATMGAGEMAADRFNTPLQVLLARFFATVLQGYLIRPQAQPQRSSPKEAPPGPCAFYNALGGSQALSRMLQRPLESPFMRPFHALCGLMSVPSATSPLLPTLAETRSWMPAPTAASLELVVPLPGTTGKLMWTIAPG